MRIFVFRPQADAERTARAIAARGHDALVAPLFTIVPLPEPAPEGAFDALVLTSGNGVAALASAPQAWRELPLFSVGARSARRARDAGFGDARSADGDRNDLVALIGSNLKPPARLLLILGRDRHEDVPDRLREAGFDVTIWTSYAAEAVSALPDAAAKALRDGAADAALHYSARGAQTFIDLSRKAGLEQQAAALTHVALSAEVAGPLIAFGAEIVLVSEYPEEAGLFAALDQVSDRHGAGQAAAKEAVASPGAAEDKGAMKDQRASRTRSGRTPPMIAGEVVATPSQAATEVEPSVALTEQTAQPAAPVAAEAAGAAAPSPEAVLPTEALPAEFDPPETPAQPSAEPDRPAAGASPPPSARKAGLPWAALAAAGLVGGVIGAGVMLLAAGRLGADSSAEQLAGLQSRIEALQASATTVDRKASAAGEAAAKAGGEAQAAAQRVVELANAQRAQAPNAEALERLSEQVRRAEAAAAAVTQRLDQTAARIGSVETLARTASAPSPQAMAATRIVLAERIRGAIQAGRPFAADVAALAKGGGAPEPIAALNAVAQAGAPTRDALLAEFGTQRATLSRELTPAASSLQDRLLGLASRIVTIRPVGETGANDPGTLLIRFETALANGNIAAAASLWDQMPEPARRASAALGDRLKKRAAADAAIATIAQDAVAALGAAG
ncbi:MAG: uroporphyrinogen-III synthase [Bosea sp. (in: a-proteobacteria)]